MLAARSGVRAVVASAASPASSSSSSRGQATAVAQVRTRPEADEEGPASVHATASSAAGTAQQQQQELLDQLQEREVRIPVPWGYIAGKWWGRVDRRPLVALHGWGDNAGSFERLAGSLRGVPVLALDLPGHGLSSRIPRGLGPHPADRGLLLATLRRVQRALGLTSVSLVGHSLGDGLALLYAATYPSDVDLYVSLDTLVPCPVDAGAEVKAAGSLTDELLDAEAQAQAAGQSDTQSPEAEDRRQGAEVEQARQALLASRSGSLNRLAAETLLRRGADLRVQRMPVLSAPVALACARAVRCPTLCVLPDWRAPRVLEADAELRARFLADLRMSAKTMTAVSVGGTHHAHLNSPEVVVPALNDFLDQHYGRQEHAMPVSSITF